MDKTNTKQATTPESTNPSDGSSELKDSSELGLPCVLGSDGPCGADSAKASDADKSIEVGMACETQDLYRSDPREEWLEWSPDDIGINSKDAPASAKFALIVRREKTASDTSEPVLALHSVTVQSPLIKEQLGRVFAGYSGINTKLKKLKFKAPFHEFFYRWPQFLQARPDDTEANKTGLEHYKLLFDIISTEIQPHIDQTGDLLSNNVLSFDYLWAIFEPGIEVYSKVNGHDRLYLLTGGSYTEVSRGSTVYMLNCRYVDTDGQAFGYKRMNLAIQEYGNLKSFSELTVIPSHLKINMTEVRRRLEDRGRRFEALKGFHHKAYSGLYLGQNGRHGPDKQYVENARVIVDGASYLKYNGGSPDLEPLGKSSSPGISSAEIDVSDPLSILNDYTNSMYLHLPHPERIMQEMARRARQRFLASRANTTSKTALSEEHYALCHPQVMGFCLKKKQWVILDVDLIHDIVWNKEAFGRLVLPHDYKRIIWAFVDAQMNGTDDFDDVIRGKGRGIIMLLSGEPGTGKTLTSESVAEAMKKPLYSMGAGELGDTAAEVEKNLDQILELSTKWEAILLLDECDVFLEKRSNSNMLRNKLVSVFLRLLEYYQGIMFLTTNRASSFDAAFESRIHLTINYPNLDTPSRLHIWRTFVQPESPSSNMRADELDDLARIDLNGRQIKNIVKTARLLATRDKEPLSLEHVQTVLRVKRGEPAQGGGMNDDR